MPPERKAPSSALDWPARAGTAELVLTELSARARRRRGVRLATALAVLACGLGTVFWLASARTPAGLADRSTRQTLPDGSIVELKAGAQFTADFTGRLRRVTLSRGTAHFQVAKNPERPFVVSAGAVAVRAVGTAFSVELGTSVVEVLVTEGRVAVESSAATSENTTVAPPPHELATVDAGAGVVLDLAAPAAAVRAVPPEAIEQKLAWRAQRIELSATPLAEVVAMLNAHSAGGQRFIIGDPEIESVKLSGVIRTDKTEALIHLLEAECGVRAESTADGIVLRKAR